MGSHKRPFYRIVAAVSRFQKDGRFLEILGYYDPKQNPSTYKVDREKVKEWLYKGAQMSETVESLLRKEGIVQEVNIAKNQKKNDSNSDKIEKNVVKSDKEIKVEGES